MVDGDGEPGIVVVLGNLTSSILGKPKLPRRFLSPANWVSDARDNPFAEVVDGDVQALIESLKDRLGNGGFTRGRRSGDDEDRRHALFCPRIGGLED